MYAHLIKEELSEHPLFKKISKYHMEKFLPHIKILHFDDQKIVRTEHETQYNLYIVRTGILKFIYKNHHNRFLTIDILKKSDFFCEIPFPLKDQMCFQSASKIELYSIPINTFLEILAESKEALLSIFYIWSNTIWSVYTILLMKAFSSNTAQLAEVLVRLSQYFGKNYGEHTLINFPITHKELSKFIGTSRESVTKTLRTFKKLDAISYLDKKIIILNIHKLHDWMY